MWRDGNESMITEIPEGLGGEKMKVMETDIICMHFVIKECREIGQ